MGWFRVCGSGCRVQVLGLRVGLGYVPFGAWGSGLGCLGFKVLASGFCCLHALGLGTYAMQCTRPSARKNYQVSSAQNPLTISDFMQGEIRATILT